MSEPSKGARGYVSPVILARNLLARARAGERISKQALSTARRIDALPSTVARQLVTHEAPYRVATWVAWGEPSEVYQRADLAVLLRRARPSKGWPDAGHLKVAFDVYLAVGAGPDGRVSDVPVERYAAALDALPKRRRVAKQRAAEESAAPPAVVGEDDVLRALIAARRPRRTRPPAIKLRTIPLRTGAGPAEPSIDIEHVQAENARLRSQMELADVEAERHRGLLRRENARLTEKVEDLERELTARSGGPSKWLVGLGGAAAGALVTEMVRKGVELFEAGDGEQRTAPGTAPAGTLDGEALLKRLLPVFDNLVLAHRHAEQGAPSAAIAEGLRVVLTQLDEALARSGVDRAWGRR